MNKLKFWMIFLITCISIITVETTQSFNKIAKSSSSTLVSNTLTTKEADILISETINAINQGNSEFFIPYLINNNQNIDKISKALEYYNQYFQGEEIAKVERMNFEKLGEIEHKKPIQRFTYKLYNSRGISKNIAIYQDQNIRILDDFLQHSFDSDKLVQKYVNALSSLNIEQISNIINPDKKRFNEQKIIEVLHKNNNLLGLKNIKYKFIEINETNQYFTYHIYGKNFKKHEVKIFYRDGFIYLIDSLFPIENKYKL